MTGLVQIMMANLTHPHNAIIVETEFMRHQKFVIMALMVVVMMKMDVMMIAQANKLDGAVQQHLAQKFMETE